MFQVLNYIYTIKEELSRRTHMFKRFIYKLQGFQGLAILERNKTR